MNPRLDETFVCADRALRDDWFRDGLWPLVRAGARFVVVVDACHSDTMILGLRPEPPPTPIVRRGRALPPAGAGGVPRRGDDARDRRWG